MRASHSKSVSRVFIITLAASLALFMSIVPYTSPSYASTQGTVLEDYTRVRERPSTADDSKILYHLFAGDTVEITSETTGAEGMIWYAVTTAQGAGYIRSDLVRKHDENSGPGYSGDADFEAYLSAQDFPESYKPALRDLHARYPRWKFVADKTGLQWADVIYRESHPVSISLVPGSWSDRWKSAEPEAYNIGTGTYTVFDSGGWNAAAEHAIAYYMDPRNSFDAYAVFQFLSNKYDASTQTAEALSNITGGTFLARNDPGSGYSSYGALLLDVGARVGANPLTLASMIIQEQGADGSGGCISGNVSGYEGYYNFFNIGAYAYGGRSAVENGLIFAESKGWDTPYKSILGGAGIYAENYVKNNKSTLYYQKFNVMNGLDSVGTYQYMTDIRGADIEGRNLSRGYSTLLNSGITFEIPVYLNMPESSSPEPSGHDNIKYLKSLAVDGAAMTPTFNYYRYSYECAVPNSCSSVTVRAAAVSSYASVSGAGSINLAVGSNKVTVTCTSSGGPAQSYTILITRSAGGSGSGGGSGSDPGPEIAPSTSVYSIGSYVTGVRPQTSCADFIAAFNKGTGSVRLFAGSGREVSSGIVSTGMILKLLDSRGKVLSSTPIIVRGDNSGDGKVNTVDALRAFRSSMDKLKMDDASAAASDLNNDNKVNTVDALMLMRYCFGKYDIKF